jgi:dipeptidyl aminopeptidase/acylaminoacyl peptidase
MKRIAALLLPLMLLAATVATADELERTVTMMAKIGSCSSPRFSPDGKRVAFLSNMTGSPQLFTIPATGGWPDQVTALDDPVGDLAWSPDGQWLAIMVAPGGGLNSQIYVLRPDGTELRRLTEGGKENNWLGDWTPDSNGILFSSNRRSGAAMDAWLVDVATGKMTLVAENPGIGTIDDVSADGRYALVNRVRSRGDNELYRVGLAGGETLLTKHTPPAEFSGVFGSRSGDVVYIGGNAGRDRFAFGRTTIAADGKVSPFELLAERADAELANAVVDDHDRHALLNWNVAGRNEPAVFDLATKRQKPLPKLKGGLADAFEFSRDGNHLVFTVSGSSSPSDIWIYELGSNALLQLTHSPHAGVDLSKLVRPELLKYKAADGLELSGWFYRPANAKPPYPTVLSFHGGPESQERPGFNTTYQALLANGIAVFAPNVRGSSGFGKRFVNLDNGALRVNGVRDIKATTDFLTGEAKLSDARRLGIMGGSYGGYMVMAGVTEYPDLFAAGADLFGVVNFETFFAKSEPWMAAVSTSEYGDPATQLEMLRSISPIHKVDRVKTPLIVLHGANDTNVPVIEAEQVVNSLKARNVPVEYILFPDEGHGWRKTANRIRSTVALTRFFTERLKRQE